MENPMRKLTFSLLAIAACLLALPSYAQQRTSPKAEVSGNVGGAKVDIVYCRPSADKRKIMGELVPYGKIWRTGANEATEITTKKDILVNNILLKAGTYSLFTIPEKDKWTIVINTDVGMWGAYNYNPKKDLWRFEVPSQTTDKIYEAFTISFDHRNEVADLLIMWDNVKVSIPFKFPN